MIAQFNPSILGGIFYRKVEDAADMFFQRAILEMIGKHMAKNSVVGLDIGASSVKGVQATLKGGEVFIEKVGSIPLAPDMIVDGRITSPEILATILTKLWKQARFTTKNVATAIGGSRTIARTAEFDWYRDDDFRKIFHMKLEDVFPVQLEDYYFDFHTLQESSKRERDKEDRELYVLKPKKFVLVVGAERSAVDDVIKSTQSAKLRPVGVDVNGLALLRAARPGISADDAADVTIDLGADTLTIVIHKFGQPIYLRNIPNVGGRPITQDIEQEFGIPHLKAEHRKLEALSIGNLPTVKPASVENSVFSFSEEEKEEMVQELAPQIERSREIIDGHMSRIINSIRETVDTFLYDQEGVDITKFSPFSLSGGVAATPGLAERLASEFQNGVALASPLTNYDNAGIPEEYANREHEFAVATGLAAGWVKNNG